MDGWMDGMGWDEARQFDLRYHTADRASEEKASPPKGIREVSAMKRVSMKQKKMEM